MANTHIIPFQASGIHNLDKGAFGKEIDRQLRKIAEDIHDRPMDVTGKATASRKVKMEFTITPVIEFDPQTEQNVLVSMAVEPSIDGICPKVVGGKTELRYTRGQLLYNKDIPSKFDQRPLFSEEPEEAEEVDSEG